MYFPSLIVIERWICDEKFDATTPLGEIWNKEISQIKWGVESLFRQNSRLCN